MSRKTNNLKKRLRMAADQAKQLNGAMKHV